MGGGEGEGARLGVSRVEERERREEQVERGVDELVCRLTIPGVLTDSENHLYTAGGHSCANSLIPIPIFLE